MKITDKMRVARLMQMVYGHGSIFDWDSGTTVSGIGDIDHLIRIEQTRKGGR